MTIKTDTIRPVKNYDKWRANYDKIFSKDNKKRKKDKQGGK